MPQWKIRKKKVIFNVVSEGSKNMDVESYKKLGVSVLTCGSVDNGKSTLLGRLLFDIGAISLDQFEAASITTKGKNLFTTKIEYAHFLDGLQDERSQNITIDIAHRYLRTKHRNFILLDSPGHTQYVKNMAVAASKADIALAVVDVRSILDITKRVDNTFLTHIDICNLMGIKNYIIVINKMDLISYRKDKFDEIVKAILLCRNFLKECTTHFIPVSATNGMNLIENSNDIPWYKGRSLLNILENIELYSKGSYNRFYMPVQYVIKDLANQFRGYCGLVGTGKISVNDKVKVIPGNQVCTVSGIFDGFQSVFSSQSMTSAQITIQENVDIARGSFIVAEDSSLSLVNTFRAKVLWINEKEKGLKERSYIFKHTHSLVSGKIISIIDTVPSRNDIKDTLSSNDIALCEIRLDKGVVAIPFSEEPILGSFIIIDHFTLETIGVGIIDSIIYSRVNDISVGQDFYISKSERAILKKQKPFVIWFTGLSGSGKTTIANLLEKELYTRGYHTIILDGDDIRRGLNADLGFTDLDRSESQRRIACLTKILLDAGLIVIVATISPFEKERAYVKSMIDGFMGEKSFFQVFVNSPFQICFKRDPKGLYAKQTSGWVSNCTGIDSVYEKPENSDWILNTDRETPTESLNVLLKYLFDASLIK